MANLEDEPLVRGCNAYGLCDHMAIRFFHVSYLARGCFFKGQIYALMAYLSMLNSLDFPQFEMRILAATALLIMFLSCMETHIGTGLMAIFSR